MAYDQSRKLWPGGREILHCQKSVSVAPAYNHENYIEKTMEGFLNQNTDFPFEILIHDDASQDKTQEILRKYENKYPKIDQTHISG